MKLRRQHAVVLVIAALIIGGLGGARAGMAIQRDIAQREADQRNDNELFRAWVIWRLIPPIPPTGVFWYRLGKGEWYVPKSVDTVDPKTDPWYRVGPRKITAFRVLSNDDPSDSL